MEVLTECYRLFTSGLSSQKNHCLDLMGKVCLLWRDACFRSRLTGEKCQNRWTVVLQKR